MTKADKVEHPAREAQDKEETMAREGADNLILIPDELVLVVIVLALSLES